MDNTIIDTLLKQTMWKFYLLNTSREKNPPERRFVLYGIPVWFWLCQVGVLIAMERMNVVFPDMLDQVSSIDFLSMVIVLEMHLGTKG